MKQRALFKIKPNEKPADDVLKDSRVNTPHKVIETTKAVYRNYEAVFCKIQQRRLQMLVHSCIYYSMNDSLITDAQFDKWARELLKLQVEYPAISETVPWYEYFKTWDATTGFDLPIRDPWVVAKATALLNRKGRE